MLPSIKKAKEITKPLQNRLQYILWICTPFIWSKKCFWANKYCSEEIWEGGVKGHESATYYNSNLVITIPGNTYVCYIQKKVNQYFWQSMTDLSNCPIMYTMRKSCLKHREGYSIRVHSMQSYHSEVAFYFFNIDVVKWKGFTLKYIVSCTCVLQNKIWICRT